LPVVLLLVAFGVPSVRAGLDQEPLTLFSPGPLKVWKVGSYNPSVTPWIVGGSGTGALEIVWAGYTNWAPVHAFTPPHIGTFSFWVRKLGDQTYNPTPPTGPFELIVAAPILPKPTLSFKRPDGSSTASPRIGDTVTVTSTATDSLGLMTVHGIRVYNPGIPPIRSGSWSDSGNWKVEPGLSSPTLPTPLLSAVTSDPFFDYIDFFYSFGTHTKIATFVLDAPGVWQFKAGIKDRSYTSSHGWYGPGTTDVLASEIASVEVGPLELSTPQSFTYPIPTIAGVNRIVGAYLNAGQIHRNPTAHWWQPSPNAWGLKWGPNPVAPLLYNTATHNKTITDVAFLADWGGSAPPSSEHVENAMRMGYELMYSGIDFVALDHTNLVFPTLYNGTNENPVIKAAHALKQGLASAGTPSGRVKMTILLGLTTAWYLPEPEMNGGIPNLELKDYLDPAALNSFVNGPTRMGAFNGLLKYLWENFADPSLPANQGVWQLDPANSKPLLLLYVGTDGPAFDRDSTDLRLTSRRITETAPYFEYGAMQEPMTVLVGGVRKSISELFSVRWVGAFLEAQAPAETTNIVTAALRSGGSQTGLRVFHKNHWEFRPQSRSALSPPTAGPVNGLGQTTISAVHSVAYRMLSDQQFGDDLERANSFSDPAFLMLTAWGEFGSIGDEFSPEESWTIMPNNKFGRRYSDLVRERVLRYKGP